MKQLQVLIEKIEIEIEKLSENIETLSEISFKYKNKTFHINKHQINKQNKEVAQSNKLIASHQKDFDELGPWGDKIEKLAREFAFTIKTLSLIIFEYLIQNFTTLIHHVILLANI